MAMYQTPSIGSAVPANPTTTTPSAWGTSPTGTAADSTQPVDPFAATDPNAANTWGDAFKSYIAQNDTGYQSLQKQYDDTWAKYAALQQGPGFTSANNRANALVSNPNSTGETQKQIDAILNPYNKQFGALQTTMTNQQAAQDAYFKKKYGGVYDQLGGLQQFQTKYGKDADPVIASITSMFNNQFKFKNPWSIPK